MTALDFGILAFTLALGLWGYRQGLIVGVLTLIGFATGAAIGSRLAPLVLNEGTKSPYAPLLAALGALIGGAMVAVTLESMALGLRERVIRNRRHLHLADGAGGAALVACVALGVVWVFGAVALHAPGTTGLRLDVQRSVILRSLNDLLPPSGPVLNALDRVDPAPSIVGPVTPVAPPDPQRRLRPRRRARRRLGRPRDRHRLRARRRGLGLGRGARHRRHQRPRRRRRGRHLGQHPLRRLARRDAGLLRPRERPGAAADRRPAAGAPARAPDASRGESGAVLGYPENGPYDAAPARFGETREVVSEDSYGRGPVQRAIASLRGTVRSGNSGGPLVDTQGRVLGTVFATTTYGNPGGFAIPDDLVAAALSETQDEVDTGPCTG